MTISSEAKVSEVVAAITDEQKEALKLFNIAARNEWLVFEFGNQSEQAGCTFGLYPAWCLEVLKAIGAA